MNLKHALLLCGLIFSCTQVFATVGGGQTLEFLGYDAKDQKLYLLRDFGDGRGRYRNCIIINLIAIKPNPNSLK